MNELPVSVIIPTYNRAKHIVRSLRSVLAAISPGDEVIVVDDGSTDNTSQVLEPYRDRIRYVMGPHRGAGAARNCGITEARNPLVAFNDSDDEWFPDKLALQRAFMQARPDVLFCFSDIGLKEEDGTESHNGLQGWHHDPRGWDEILGSATPYSSIAALPPGRKDFNVHIGSLYETMLRACYVPAQAAMVRQEPAGDALHFGEDAGLYLDYECFIRLSRIGNAAYFDCETAWQCGHSEPRLTGVNNFENATFRIKVLQRTFGADPKFLAQHNERYQEALKAEYMARARYLIRNGRRKEAREELRLAEGGPLSYRLLAAMPGPLAQSMLGLARRARHGVLKFLMNYSQYAIPVVSATSGEYL
ncbi:MAG TPA: glycosyltransferase family A protein [Blastocatellia bacterium]|nr:glycosyltransferase family A protein [Blastocatellia bacterium]